MGAIDLLFGMKLDSERLHQIALASLLRHGPLLSLLGVMPPERKPQQHVWEPIDGAFDLAVQLDDGSRLLVELKVDSALNQDQMRRQIQELRAEGRTADRLLYLLLGFAAITRDPPSIDRMAKEVGVAKERYSVRTAVDLARALQSPQILESTDAEGRDARDLAVAYRTHVLELDGRTRHFFTHPVAEWRRGDYFGFFAHLRATFPQMALAGIDRVNNPGGGFVGCWWGSKAVEPGVKVYLQFEGPRLMVKLKVTPRERRGALRDQACTHLLSLGARPPIQIVRPAKLGHGEWMTIGHLEGLPFGLPDRAAELAEALSLAEESIAEVARRMQAR